MERVKVDQVIKSYREMGLTPIREGWAEYNRRGEVHRACGLTAVAICKNPQLIDRDNICASVIREELGLSREYVDGFADGFDNDIPHSDHPDYKLGYDDGTISRIEIFDEEEVV